jgi:hypothetical protein
MPEPCGGRHAAPQGLLRADSAAARPGPCADPAAARLFRLQRNLIMAAMVPAAMRAVRYWRLQSAGVILD